MEHLPYNLQAETGNSDEYYRTIAAFTDRWLVIARRRVAHIIPAYQHHQARNGQTARSFDECAFEFLALGVLLRQHVDQAVGLPLWMAGLLQKLVIFQERHKTAERPVKLLRGVLGGLAGVFVDGVGRYRGVPAAAHWQQTTAVQMVDQLLAWLRAQGEFTQAERFAAWRDYLARLHPHAARRTLRQAYHLAEEFAHTSAQTLRDYTHGVEPYLAETAPACRWRYDAALVTRGPLEYHLGMLGTEILNRAYRTRFQATTRRMIIVPPCLRALPAPACQAVQTPLGRLCQGCTPTCRIHQITRLAARNGVPVYSIPDDQLSKLCVATGQAGSQELGVIGLACAPRNWSAGWEAERLGLAAQGVLLDYAGCQKHWQPEDLPTDTNLAILQAEMAGENAALTC